MRSESSASAREELVEFVGLAGLRDADVGTLSFGQGRLLEIARALAGEPRVILFDEPAAGLTPAELDRLAGIIRGIAERGIAVLLIEHDMRFLLPLASRVVVLNFGARIAEGTPAGSALAARGDGGLSWRCCGSLTCTPRMAPPRCCKGFRSWSTKARPWRCSAPTAPGKSTLLAAITGTIPRRSGSHRPRRR